MPKFKKGDVIKISDTTDPGYKSNNQYLIEDVIDNVYVIRSKQHNGIVDHDVLSMLRYGDNFSTFTEYIDAYYRLITEAEKVLYGK